MSSVEPRRCNRDREPPHRHKQMRVWPSVAGAAHPDRYAASARRNVGPHGLARLWCLLGPRRYDPWRPVDAAGFGATARQRVAGRSPRVGRGGIGDDLAVVPYYSTSANFVERVEVLKGRALC